MTDPTGTAAVTRISGRSARFATSLFHYGCIAAILLPIPLGLLWLGASIVVYAMNRHHPNPKVGHYTQRMAYVFYGVAGFFVAVGIFFSGTSWVPYAVAWAVGAVIVIPWAVLELLRIRRDTWEDLTLESQPEQI